MGTIRREKAWVLFLGLALLLGVAMAETGAGTAGEDTGTAPDRTRELEATAQPVVEQFMDGPSVFVENAGQWADNTIRFALDGTGANVGMTDRGPRFQVFLAPDPTQAVHGLPPEESPRAAMHAFSVVFDGAAAIAPQGEDPAEQTFNYLLGEPAMHRENVPSWNTVWYRELYPNIDLEMTGRRTGLKYNFHLDPGADIRQIRLRYEGIEKLAVCQDGAISISLVAGWPSMTDAVPYIYQDVDGQKISVAGRYVLLDEHTYGFEITGPYDADRPLVIDPIVSWGSYLGGSGVDSAEGVAVYDDGVGPAIEWLAITGETYSSGWVSGGWDTSLGGARDAYVVKLGLNGSHVWSTYLGGTGDEAGNDVAVDSSSRVLVTGMTNSAGWVSGGYNPVHNGGWDGFVVALNPLGGHLWSTYFGGGSTDVGYGIAVDASNYVYVAGSYYYAAWSAYTCLTLRIDSAGGYSWGMVSGAYNGLTHGHAIAVTPNNVYVTGTSTATGWTTGGWDNSHNGGYDAFALRFNKTGTLQWSTYLGGAGTDMGHGIAADSAENVYVTGETAGFTTWPGGGWRPTYGGGGNDGFVVKLNSACVPQWSSYLGGSAGDTGRRIKTDSAGSVYMSGLTSSSGWVNGGWDSSTSGGDGYLVKLTTNGAHVWSSYVGGSAYEHAAGVALDSSNSVYCVGWTSSTGWLTGAWDSSLGGTQDGFVLKVAQITTTPVAPGVSGVARTNDTTPTWAWSYDDRGSLAYRCRIDGGAWTPEFGALQYTAPTPLGAGSHTVEVQQRNDMLVWGPSGSFSFTVDLTAPTATVSTTAPDPTNLNPIPVTVTFSEQVTGFDDSKVYTSNGVVSNFGGTGSVYTFDVVPISDGPVLAACYFSGVSDLAGIGFRSGANFQTQWFGSGTTRPFGVVARGSTVYVTYPLEDHVQIFNPNGGFLGQWGGTGTANGQFDTPSGIALDASGDVLVVDSGNARVQKFTAGGGFLSAWGSSGSGDGQFINPRGITVDSEGNIYVVDPGAARVQKFAADGTYMLQWGTNGTGDGQFGGAYAIAVDPADNVFVVEQTNNRVQKFTPDGVFVTKWGTPGTGNGQFSMPSGIATDRYGYVYVADTSNSRVQLFDYAGTFIQKWGQGSPASIITPYGIGLAGDGFVYIADQGIGSGVVQKYLTLANAESIALKYDGAPPTGTITINSGDSYATSRMITLNLEASDGAGSGVTEMQFSADPGYSWYWTEAEPFSTSKTIDLGTYAAWNGDGLHFAYVRFKDAAGNWSTAEISDDIILDTQAPTGTININGGGPYTNIPMVTLGLSAVDTASGVADMRFSNDTATWSGWQAYTTSAAWTLSSGDGLKTVYVEYRDNVGHVSSHLISNQITLDSTAPAQAVWINAGEEYTRQSSVTLSLLGTLGGAAVAHMRFSSDGASWGAWEPYATSKPWTLTVGDGLKTVYVQYRDTLGNPVNGTVSDTITLDTTAPTGTILINGGAAYTNSRNVTLTVVADDGTGSGVDQMRFSADPVYSWGWTASEPVSSSKTIDFGAYGTWDGEGVHFAYLRLSDALGNWSTSEISDNIILDSSAVGISITLDDPNPTDLDVVRFSVDFSESAGVSLTADHVSLTGVLGATVAVTGTDPNFTVSATLADPEANGTLGIVVGTDAALLLGNPYAGGTSPVYTIANWAVFSIQPQGGRMYTGDAHTFEVAVAPAPAAIAYQWKWDDGSKAVQDGPATPTWTLTGLTPADTGNYWCEVTFNATVHVSNMAVLSVADHLAITLQPQGGYKGVGDSHSFSVTTEGGHAPVHHAWFKDDQALADATEPVLSLDPLGMDDAGIYTVQITDDYTDAVESDPAELFVTVGMPVSGVTGLCALAAALAAIGLSRKRQSH